MSPPPSKLLLLSVALLMSIADSQSSAAIVVENMATQQSSTSGGDASFTFSGFGMDGGNFLAVLYSGERSVSGSDATDVEVTFAGVGMTNATPFDTVSNEGAQIASINYSFFAGDTVGDVVVTLPVAYRGAVSVISLSGVGGLQDFGTFDETLGANATWDKTLQGTAGGFVLGAAVDNTFSTSDAANFAGGFIDNHTLSLRPDFAAGGSAAVAHGYGAIDVTGAFTQTFDPAGSGTVGRTAGAYLTLTMSAVPEVGSFMAFTIVLGIPLGLRRLRRPAR